MRSVKNARGYTRNRRNLHTFMLYIHVCVCVYVYAEAFCRRLPSSFSPWEPSGMYVWKRGERARRANSALETRDGCTKAEIRRWRRDRALRMRLLRPLKVIQLIFARSRYLAVILIKNHSLGARNEKIRRLVVTMKW